MKRAAALLVVVLLGGAIVATSYFGVAHFTRDDSKQPKRLVTLEEYSLLAVCPDPPDTQLEISTPEGMQEAGRRNLANLEPIEPPPVMRRYHLALLVWYRELVRLGELWAETGYYPEEKEWARFEDANATILERGAHPQDALDRIGAACAPRREAQS